MVRAAAPSVLDAPRALFHNSSDLATSASARFLLTEDELRRSRGGVARTDLAAVTVGNLVELQLDTATTWARLATLINATNREGNSGDYAALAATTMGPAPLLPLARRAVSLDDLVVAAVQRNTTCLLASGDLPDDDGAHEAVVALRSRIEAASLARLSGSRLIIDNSAALGVNVHEKLALVRARGELSALVGGGIDVHYSKWRDHGVNATERRRLLAAAGFGGHELPPEKREGYLDRTLEVRGGAAADVARHFASRWGDLLGSEASGDAALRLVSSSANGGAETGDSGAVSSRRGSQRVQLLRTRPCEEPSRLVHHAAFASFAPRGERSVLAGFAKAIRIAERYVYIEDKGLAPTMPDELLDALRAALPRVQAVVIVTQRDWAIPRHSWLSDLLLQCAGSTLAQLQAEHPQKLRLYTRADGAYMHSKLLLVDDEYMAVGSANFDTPSLTFQGEFSAAVTDDESVANADGVQVGAAVLTTRLAVWSDQLGRSVEWLRASPLTAALAAFEAADARVRPLQAPAPSPLCRKAAADVFRSLEGRCRDGPDEAPDASVDAKGNGTAVLNTSTFAALSKALAAPSPTSLDRLGLLHIAKTGGTAIEELGARLGVRWGARRSVASWPVSTTSLLCGPSPQHVPRALFAAHGDPDPYAGTDTFCVVRHPLTRAVSEYVYQAQESPSMAISSILSHRVPTDSDLCTAHGLNTFIRGKLDPIARHLADLPATLAGAGGRLPPGVATHRCHWLPQWLYVDGLGGAGARPCDHLLFYENLSIGLPPLLRAYGHSGNVSLPRANQLLSRSSAEVCPGLNVSSLDVESRALLREAYARDFERFGYG